MWLSAPHLSITRGVSWHGRNTSSITAIWLTTSDPPHCVDCCFFQWLTSWLYEKLRLNWLPLSLQTLSLFSYAICSSETTEKWNAKETILPCFKLLGKNRPVGLYQTKNFCTAKQTINRMKRQLTKSEKIFTNHHLRKDTFSKCTTNFYKSIRKQTNQSNFKLCKGLEQMFLQRWHTNGQQVYGKMLI